jgi:hypothetical protein
MHILKIEHPVRDFDAWKATFDSDPIGREQGGVRRYRIMRPHDDPQFVMVDLEFETRDEAYAFEAALRTLWGRAVAEGLIESPRTRFVEEVESKER